jgi:hypothetical protein
VSAHVRGVLLTAYAGYAALCAGLHLARRNARRAATVAVPMAVATLFVAVAGLASDGVVWVLAAGVLVSLAAHHRSER